jgi:hypothetical protein
MNRTTIVRGGPARAVFGTTKLWTSDDIIIDLAPTLQDVTASLYGPVDKVKTDLVVRIPLRLWGAWKDLAVLFPSVLVAPVRGVSVFPADDVALVLYATNGDVLTFHNAAITKLANLYLGADENMFAAEVEFTALLAKDAVPGAASSYFTYATGGSYTAEAFAKTHFLRVRHTAAWDTATAGLDAFDSLNGFRINWNIGLQPVVADGLGTIDMIVDTFEAECVCQPVGETLADVLTQLQANLTANGTLTAALGCANLIITGGSGLSSVTLKKAYIASTKANFSAMTPRVGETTFKTILGITTGVPDALAVLATSNDS